MITVPGNVAIINRQALHGSFANTGCDWPVTVNFGFHPRRSVLGVEGGGLHAVPVVYDTARIRARSRVIDYAIDARRQRFRPETPHLYKPFVESGDIYRWDDAARTGMHDCNLLDFSI